MKTRILCLIFFFFISIKANADVFVVTSKADGGPGTLREALTLAAANGGTAADAINFNLPGNTEADRTIVLLNELPEISGNLIIDGSTQPGAGLGMSTAKIMLRPDPSSYIQSISKRGCFMITRVGNIEIYGICFDQFTNIRAADSPFPVAMPVINIEGGTDITIGGPGRGNVFASNNIAIGASPSLTIFRVTTRLKIQSNWFGVNPDGSETSLSMDAFVFLFADEVEFGGSSSTFGNRVAGSISNASIILGANGKVNFNNFGILPDGRLSAKALIFNLNITSGEINDNKANFLGFISTGKSLKFLRNKELAISPLAEAAINLNNAQDIQIGSDDLADVNEFLASNRISTIANQGSARVQVRKNIIHCAPTAYSIVNAAAVVIQVLVNNDTEYSGTAVAGSEIYIYNDNSDCPTCSPLQFYTQVVADATGKWRITGDFRSNRFVANATLVHTSSTFTQPHILLAASRLWYKKNDPGCGGGNGTLELANPEHILRVEWYDAVTNQKVGEGLQIVGLLPGRYYAIGYNGKCFVQSPGVAELTDVTPVFNDRNLQVIQPGCGANNGSIKGVVYDYRAGPSTFRWIDDNGRTVSDANLDLINLGAGSYTLVVTSGTSCVRSYGPIVLQNTNSQGPTFDETAVVIKKATCGNANGSIKGINIFNAATVKWLNASNVVVGSSAELSDVPAGRYKLTISNGSCTTTSSEFVIEAAISNQSYFPVKQFKDATCNQNNGNISISFNQLTPKAMRWVDASTNAVIGTSSTLSNLSAGFYKLYLTDENSCESLYETYQIKTIIPPVLAETGMRIVNDQCGLRVGSIKGISVSGGIVPYHFEWRNQANQVVATTTDLTKAPAGKYTFRATDDVGCTVTSNTFTINTDETGLPEPIVPDVQICAPGIAAIIPQQVATGAFLLYAGATDSQPLATTKDFFKLNVAKTGVYYVSYSTGVCESRRVAVSVLVAENSLTIVNTFSPNNDGINDTWKIKDLEKYPEFTLHIFNRNGQEVFSTRDPNFAFDGMNNGTVLPVGVYYYMLSLRVGCATITGSLTLLR
ncbi:gliding motility-associated C-terminal domain-containing protein [Pedobacter duraquae]|uniref:Gliding motility-associated-like protein n=1 Tax=Pedobacter duraquae TaxID=425511 RepID=A0A4R6ICR6_9SPHI|nr:gliding motility-associated C-terminal domain-containing protein [Pedobacter duraquae]TDO19308.1 gliding motility-associated-like protein [Pedobacter duraquae]